MMTAHLRNRLFTNPYAFNRTIPSGNSFDEVVAHLQLSPNEYRDSPALREWVRHNKNQRYVPTELLNAFGFEVDC
jgi:hypothetical protein